MFEEIDEMTGNVFENPEDRQIMMVQVWLVEQDFPSNFSNQRTLFYLVFLWPLWWNCTHGDMLEKEPRSQGSLLAWKVLQWSCPLQMMTAQVGLIFTFFCKYLPTIKPPFQGNEINNTAILLSSSPLPSPLLLFCKTSFGGSGIICSRVRSSDLYSVILGCITSNFLYLCFPLCILVLPVDWYHLM